ncbi:NAD(P)-dependent oxidoreductase [Alkalicoccus daliensis]|uniref:Predicted homoserine dehydrogenase, contains C-terminal SAF domain n=1 Tax=Alkalicoccus daliensis TaxID=745820 RepID=A0A1G9ZKB3_9BACI|nr:NAD(P)-dependent oxidoreductase [Alkalicoccus daliensis]SDN21922.1 Predicted homoserine dehydrogenase, contains C-terminal SAF domain [Alkalicoccus daliensis]
MINIGISGTGFIAAGLYKRLVRDHNYQVSSVLTRRRKEEVAVVPQSILTNNLVEFTNKADIIVECSGDIEHGSNVIEEAHFQGLPVVTMNAELQVTTGSYFTGTGYITEAEGDQPGSLASLNENMIDMGFHPLVYGNIKGFLNTNPTLKDMKYWANLKGISLAKVTSFTDGTKVQIEQALVANGLNAAIIKQGLSGLQARSIEGAGAALAAEAIELKTPISDYIIRKEGPPGVFISATHEDDQQNELSYFKVGDGPIYTLTTPYHLCHLEIIKTIKRVVEGKKPLLTNSTNPSVSVAGIAKRDLNPGEYIREAIGSFDIRGEAVTSSEKPDHVPIGLMKNMIIEKPIKEGEVITFQKITLPPSRIFNIWKTIQTAKPITQGK